MSDHSTDGTYRYAVPPANEIFETRHEAVGFAAVHGRKYTYSPMNSIDGPVPLRVEPFRYDETEHGVEHIEVLPDTHQRFTEYRTPPEDEPAKAADEGDFVRFLLDLFEEHVLEADRDE